MAELTYDQFSSSNDLTEMASQINAAIEKLSKRIDELDGGAGALIDPMSQGVAINLADSFGRTLESYLNNPNKKMLGDWILEGSLTVDGQFQSASSDPRVVINSTTSTNRIFFYNGSPSETAPAHIRAEDAGTEGHFALQGPAHHASNTIPYVNLKNPDAATGSSVELGGDAVVLSAPLTHSVRIDIDTPSIRNLNSGGYTLHYSNGEAAMSLTENAGISLKYNDSTKIATTNTGVAVTGTAQASDGTAALPSYSFTSDTNTGMYRVAADQIGFATGGVLRGRFWSGGLLMSTATGAGNMPTGAGTAAAPSYSFYSDTNTGMYRKTTDTIGWSTGGAERMYLNSGGLYLASGDWFRTTGSAGWYNQTYGGGWKMQDTTWVRTHNNKGILTSGGMAAALFATTSTSGYQYVMRSTAYTVLAYYTSSRKLKENIVDVVPADSGAWMDALQPVMFTERWLGEGVEPADSKAWREADMQVGFIAEDVLENDIISQFSQAKKGEDDELEAVGWKWECVIAASVAEIKSLRSRLAAADDLNKTLDERLNILEKKV